MRRVGLVARREFVTTVGSKGFLIGLLIMPAIALLLVLLVPRILGSQRPDIRADVALIDRTGRLGTELRAALDPATLAARQAERSGGGGPPQFAAIPRLTLIERPREADVEEEKHWLLARAERQPHRALVVIEPDAVERAHGSRAYGAYELYVSAGLNQATEGVLRESLRRALVDARLEASGLDPAAVQAAMDVPRSNATIVAASGEQAARRGFSQALPFIFGVLLFMGVITGGQTLMTSTVEEKSSRVIEVLLAAVSPLELMWGKLIGQLGVGLLVLSVYVALGVLGLSQFAMLGLLDPTVVLYLFVFYLITYLVFGALMLAVGSAVSQMADAQSLMGPIMLLLIAPYILAPFIGQAPNSAFSVAVSFVPPVNTFAMLARLASDTPPPAWQVWLSVLVGAATACAAVWFAAKTFRIGLLMHGKPPSFATLVRWARMS